MSSTTFTYGNPASLTGPCLVTNCQTDLTTDSASCGYTIQKCTAGSIAFDNPVDPSDQQEKCSYAFRDTTQELSGTCTMKELSGELEGLGDAWSIVDAATTVMLAPTVVTQSFDSGVTSVTFLGVDDTAVLDHFITGGQAEVATNTVVASTTGSFKSTTAGTARTTPIATVSTSTPQTMKSSKTSVSSSSANTDTVSSPQTSSSAAATTSTAKSGQNRLQGHKIGVFVVVGGLLLSSCML